MVVENYPPGYVRNSQEQELARGSSQPVQERVNSVESIVSNKLSAGYSKEGDRLVKYETETYIGTSGNKKEKQVKAEEIILSGDSYTVLTYKTFEREGRSPTSKVVREVTYSNEGVRLSRRDYERDSSGRETSETRADYTKGIEKTIEARKPAEAIREEIVPTERSGLIVTSSQGSSIYDISKGIDRPILVARTEPIVTERKVERVELTPSGVNVVTSNKLAQEGVREVKSNDVSSGLFVGGAISKINEEAIKSAQKEPLFFEVSKAPYKQEYEILSAPSKEAKTGYQVTPETIAKLSTEEYRKIEAPVNVTAEEQVFRLNTPKGAPGPIVAATGIIAGKTILGMAEGVVSEVTQQKEKVASGLREGNVLKATRESAELVPTIATFQSAEAIKGLAYGATAIKSVEFIQEPSLKTGVEVAVYAVPIVGDIGKAKIIPTRETIVEKSNLVYTPEEYALKLEKEGKIILSNEPPPDYALGSAKIIGNKVEIRLAKNIPETERVIDKDMINFYKNVQGEDLSSLEGLRYKQSKSTVLAEELTHAEDLLKSRFIELEARAKIDRSVQGFNIKFIVPEESQISASWDKTKLKSFEDIQKEKVAKNIEVIPLEEGRYVTKYNLLDENMARYVEGRGFEVKAGESSSIGVLAFKVGEDIFRVKISGSGEMLKPKEGVVISSQKDILDIQSDSGRSTRTIETEAITKIGSETETTVAVTSLLGKKTRVSKLETGVVGEVEGREIFKTVGQSFDIEKGVEVQGSGKAVKGITNVEASISGQVEGFGFTKLVETTQARAVQAVEPIEIIKKVSDVESIKKVSTSESGEVLLLEGVGTQAGAQSAQALAIKEAVKSVALKQVSEAKANNRVVPTLISVPRVSVLESKTEAISKLDVAPKLESVSKTEAIYKLDVAPKLESVSKTEAISKLDVAPKLESVSKTEAISKLDVAPKLESVSRTEAISKLDVAPKVSQISESKPLEVQVLVFPILNPSKSKEIKSRKRLEVRRKGKFIPVAFGEVDELTKRGERVLSETLAASFKITEDTGKIVPVEISRGFTPSKKERFVVVQPRERRLSSPFEVSEIRRSRRLR